MRQKELTVVCAKEISSKL